MGKSAMSLMITYVLLAMSVIICKTSADGTALEADDINNGVQNTGIGLELFLERKLLHLLNEYPSLLKYVSLNDPEPTEIQSRKFKRLAGLENLDFMTSKLPLRTNAAMSDIAALMRAVGRRK